MFAKWILFCIPILFFISFTYSELVKHYPCHIDPNKNRGNCEINEVHIEPCPEAETGDPCALYKKQEPKIIFTFTPNFTAETIQAQVYSATLFVDLPLPDQNTNGCLYTSCPVTAGKSQLFKFSLPIIEYYPSGPYLTKWRIWNNSSEECCFTTRITII